MPTTFNMSDVMISYSRKDKVFVQRLNQALKDSGREVWVDWDDIPPTVDWWSEIQAGIDAANTIVFIISPDSIRSGPCLREIEHASTNNKRIVPVLYRPLIDKVDEERMHPALKIHNWVYFREEDDFNEAFRKLVHALEIDLDHAQKHTRLLVRAQEWDSNHRKNSLLLRGDDLANAEIWLTQSINSNPPPTALQAEYITASRKAAIRFRQVVAGAMAAAMVILALLGLFAFNQFALAQDSIHKADYAGTQVGIAAQAFETQKALSIQIQQTADAAGTQAVSNQMTADAAAAKGIDIQNTADAAATAASNAQATSATEAAILQLTSNAAGTDAALANDEAQDAQNTAIANAATADAARLAADVAQQTAAAQAIAATAAKQTFDAQAIAAAQTLAAQRAAATNVLGTVNAQSTIAAATATPGAEISLSISLANNALNALKAGDRSLAMHLILLAVDRPGLEQPVPLIVEQAFYEIAYSVGLRRNIADEKMLVNAVAYNPMNVNQVALGLTNGNIELQDLVTNRITVLTGHTRQVNSLAFSPDGTYLVSASDDTTLKSWNVATGQKLDSWTQKGNGILSVAFSPSGNFIASASFIGGTDPNNVHLFNFSRETDRLGKISEIWGLRTNASANSIIFRPDESLLAIGTYNSVHIVNRIDETKETILVGPVIANDVAFSPDGKSLIAGSNTNLIYTWVLDTTTQSYKPNGTWASHTDHVTAVAFSPDGNYAVSGAADTTLRLWDTKTGKTIGDPWTGHTYAVKHVVFSSDGKFVISSSDDKTARLWDASIGQAVGNPWLGHTDTISNLAFSPNGNYVVSGSVDKTLHLWDPTTGLTIGNPWTGHTAPINRVAFSPDGSYVISGAGNFYGFGELLLWSVNTPTNPSQWARMGNTGAVFGVAYSPPDSCRIPGSSPPITAHLGTCVASGGNDSTLRLWDTATGIVATTIKTSDWINSVAFSPKNKCPIKDISTIHLGTCVIAGLHNGQLWLIDLTTGKKIGDAWGGGIGAMSSVAFSPDGQFVVSGSSDRILRIWKVETGTSIIKIVHSSVINSVAFSPDGQFVVSGSDDSKLRVFDAATGQAIGAPWIGHTGPVTGTAFSPDGNYLVSGSGDRTLRLWAFRDVSELIAWTCVNRYGRYMSDAELGRYNINRQVDSGLTSKCSAVDQDSHAAAQVVQAFQAEGEVTPEITPEFTPEMTPEITPEVTAEITPETTAEAAVNWIPSGGWTATENGWTIANADPINLLTADRPFDVSAMAVPQLHFSSLLNGGASLATVQVSADGTNWTLLETLSSASELKDEVIDLSAYLGQPVWLQFAWFYTPSDSDSVTPESWSIAEITVADTPVLPTLTPSAEVTEIVTPEITDNPETTASPEVTETATLEPSLTPGLTLSPDVLTPATAVEPTLTPPAWFASQTPTPVPQLLALPVFASMDDGAPGWLSSGGWILTDAARFGDAGLGWMTGAGAVQNTLTWQQSLDLGQALVPQLHFASWLQNNISLAVVNVSTDGVSWQPVAQINPSATWAENIVDLSAYRGQIIWLQFLWLTGTPKDGQPADYWMLDNVQVVDVTPLPTATMSPSPDFATPSPSIEPTATYTATEIPSLTPTETLIPTETSSPTEESAATPTLTPSNTETAIDTIPAVPTNTNEAPEQDADT